MQKYFRLPCGQGLQSAQLYFTLPCGQGLQSAQLCFSLPCEHRFLCILILLVRRVPARHGVRHGVRQCARSARVVAFSWIRLIREKFP